MTLTRDSRGSGDFTLTCDGCRRKVRAQDGVLAAEFTAWASGRGWACTRKADTCPACTRKAAKAPAKRKR